MGSFSPGLPTSAGALPGNNWQALKQHRHIHPETYPNLCSGSVLTARYRKDTKKGSGYGNND
jgi:hypothetical protein